MNQDIFLSTKNFTFTDDDTKAAVKIQEMIKEARSHMPDEFYTVYNLMYSDQARKTRLFKQLKTIPKGSMHHLHIDCTEDQDFYREHIINDPVVYLTEDLKQFRIGTKEEASKEKWVPITQARKKFASQDEFVKAVANITMFNRDEMKKYTGNQKEIWDAFEVKICNFFPIYFALHIFKKYFKHVLIKYAKNGYDRVEFRALLCKFNEYDLNGKFIKEHDQKVFMDIVDEVLVDVRKMFPHLTIGFIFFGLKVFTDQQNSAVFSKVCDLNWDKTVGLDFVQQEDLYGDLQSYDKVVDNVLAKYPHLNYKKVYHAGETRDHLTKNIEIAIKAGAVRIGHGLNILQRPEYLAYCKNICFEKNPVSNLVLGYLSDTRLSSAPVLLGLGYPITINPDDPGKFGLEDNTMDYFVAACSYPWSLKHLKLIAIHSINHSICSEQVRNQLLHTFTLRWNKWISNLIKEDQIKTNPFVEDLAIFSAVRNWSFSEREMEAERKFTDLINDTRQLLPSDFYHNDKFLLCLNEMKSTQLYSFLKTIPKSVLQHNHFSCDEDFQFYKNHMINDPNLYLNKDKNQFQYGTQQQAHENQWVPLSEIRKNYENEDQFIEAVSNVTIFSETELREYSGKEKLIWSKFQDKMDAFVPILMNLKFFRPYVKHVFMKFINNNYDRIELRAKIENLNEYDEKGNFIKQYDFKKYVEVIDEVLKEVQKSYPNFTAGFIFAGLKALSDQENEKMFDQICKLEWKNTLGFDFVQEEALYGSLAKYNSVVDKVLKKYPHLDYKKVYHAGESKDQMNKNLQIAIQSGSVRIGDGINALQRIEFLANRKSVCFEQNPTTNLLLGYSGDSRNASTPVLLGLGFPVTINSDDPGKFRLDDATSDYFMAAVSYKWRLRHLKLVALHALNHSICPTGQKLILQEIFERKWSEWIENFIKAKIY